MPALPQILHAENIEKVVSRLQVVNDDLQTFFGMGRGGALVEPVAIRSSSYDVFNETREVAHARRPGAPRGTIARQIVGNVPYTIPRTAEKLPMLLEELDNLRMIGGPSAMNDVLGASYLTRQAAIIRQRIVNLREFQIAAMLRGSYGYTVSGDDLIHGFSGTYTVDYQIPAGNKGQLDMLGSAAPDAISATWATAGTKIIDDIVRVDKYMTQLTGRRLSDIWTTSTVWLEVLDNTQVQAMAGSVNQPFSEWNKDSNNKFSATLKGLPWVRWHITNNGLNLNGTFTQLIPDTAAVFLPEMDSSIMGIREYHEPIVERDGMEPTKPGGEHYWASAKDDPACYFLNTTYNGLPVLYVPAAIAYGTVIF